MASAYFPDYTAEIEIGAKWKSGKTSNYKMKLTREDAELLDTVVKYVFYRRVDADNRARKEKE